MNREDKSGLSRTSFEIADSDLRKEETFPILTDKQLEKIGYYGENFGVPADTVLYRRGDRNIDFYVILDGAVEAFEVDASGECRGFHTHRRGSFVMTGHSKVKGGGSSPYQTSVPGIFAIGDVRSGSVKRAASAVGEGSVVVSWAHQYLNTQIDLQDQRKRVA